MNQKPLAIFLLSVFCLFATFPSYAQTKMEQVQVIPGELPDPSIIEVDGVYYATGTSGDWAPIYPIYRSTDLKSWELISYVFSAVPDWAMSDFWAPELFYKDGTFFCYYTARGKDGISKIGVATTKDITKGFEDQGVIITWGKEAIDAFVYDDKGQLYITWKAYGLDQEKPVTLLGSQLTDDGLALKGKEFVTLTADADTFEDHMIEGQCIVKYKDYLYMLYSANGCCGAGCNYQVGVARAKSMEGPWEKAPSNPLMVGNAAWKCPGHGTVVHTQGKWYYLYHGYNTKGFPSLGRAAIFSELYWDDATGWPYFKVDDNTTVKERLVKDLEDSFEGEHLKMFWRTNLRSKAVKVALTNGKLELTDTAPDPKDKTGAVLCVIPDDSDFEFMVTVKDQNKALKGLVCYTTQSKSLGLGVKGNDLVLWKVVDGQYEEISKTKLQRTENVQLRAKVHNSKGIDFEYHLESGNWISLPTVAGDNLAWWSSGMKVGLQVKQDPASADATGTFDDFSIRY